MPAKPSATKVALLALLPLLFVGTVYSQSDASNQLHASDGTAQSCLEAAKTTLGPDAEVLKCGHLTGTDALETVAVIRLKQFEETEDGVPISKFVFLRQEKSRWTVELSVDRKNWIKNSAGYIGIDFIDDSADFIGYRASFSDRRSDGFPGFTIYLYFLAPSGHNEGIATEVAWNPLVKRFQEFAYSQDPVGFRPEVKNPPHIRSRKTAP